MSDDFNFEDFISGAQLPRRTVHAYKIDHGPAIAALQAQYVALGKDAGTDDRESSTGGRSKIADQIDALRAEMESSRIEFVIRTLTPAEFKKLREDDALNVEDQLATQSIQPKLTREQWARVGAAIGTAQWGTLVDEANALVLSKVAVPDFSRTV